MSLIIHAAMIIPAFSGVVSAFVLIKNRPYSVFLSSIVMLGAMSAMFFGQAGYQLTCAFVLLFLGVAAAIHYRIMAPQRQNIDSQEIMCNSLGAVVMAALLVGTPVHDSFSGTHHGSGVFTLAVFASILGLSYLILMSLSLARLFYGNHFWVKFDRLNMVVMILLMTISVWAF